MSVTPLPAQPSLDHLKYQARDLLKGLASHDPAALRRIREFHPRFAALSETDMAAQPFKLSDAQLVVAREYGFSQWNQLREHVNLLAIPADFRDALVRGNLERVQQIVASRPALANIVLPDEGHAQVGGGTQPTALHLAIVNGHVEMARTLVGMGADVNKKDPLRSGVHLAIEHCPSLIDFLLEQGAQIDVSMAANLGRLDLLRDMLVRDPQLANDRSTGGSPLEWAAWGGKQEVAKLLLEHGANIDEDRHAPGAAIRMNAVEVLELFLDSSEAPAVLINNSKLLHVAVGVSNTHQNVPIIKLLLARGADLGLTDEVGRTPLALAMEMRREPRDPFGHETPEVVAVWLDQVIEVLRRANG